jgi:hypothetical protein
MKNNKWRDPIYIVAFFLTLSGPALIYYIYRWDSFESYPNHQRLGMLIPATCGYALMYVDTWRNWEAAESEDRLRAVGAAFCAVMLPLASLAWWIFNPTAHA